MTYVNNVEKTIGVRSHLKKMKSREKKLIMGENNVEKNYVT